MNWKKIIKVSKNKIFAFLFIVSDYGAVLVAEQTARFLRSYIGRYQDLPVLWEVPSEFKFLAIPIIFIIFNQFERLYSSRMLFWQMAGKIFKTSIYTMLIWAVLFFATKEIVGLSRLYCLLLWGGVFPTALIFRYVCKKILLRFDFWQVPVILIGAGKTAEIILNSADRERGLGYKIIGYIEDRNEVSVIFSKIPRLGKFQDLERIIKHSAIRTVLIATPGIERERLLGLVHSIQPHVDNVIFIPDIIGIPVIGLQADSMFSDKIILLKVQNNLSQVYNRTIKALFDIVVGTVIFLLFLSYQK